MNIMQAVQCEVLSISQDMQKYPVLSGENKRREKGKRRGGGTTKGFPSEEGQGFLTATFYREDSN